MFQYGIIGNNSYVIYYIPPMSINRGENWQAILLPGTREQTYPYRQTICEAIGGGIANILQMEKGVVC